MADDEVTAKLTEAALSADLRPSEIRATIKSGLTAGQRYPRHLGVPEPGQAGRHAPVPRR